MLLINFNVCQIVFLFKFNFNIKIKILLKKIFVSKRIQIRIKKKHKKFYVKKINIYYYFKEDIILN